MQPTLFLLLLFGGSALYAGTVQKLDSLYFDSPEFSKDLSAMADTVIQGNFSPSGISSNLVTVSSSLGRIVGNQWVDCAGACPGGTGYTIWTFSQPVNGFGADWTLGGILSSLLVFQNGPNAQSWPLETQPDDGLHDYYFGFNGSDGSTGKGFFGMVSHVPFTQILVFPDGENDANYQPYTMSDLWFGVDPSATATAPEPSASSLLLLVAIAVPLLLLRRPRIMGS